MTHSRAIQNSIDPYADSLRGTAGNANNHCGESREIGGVHKWQDALVVEKAGCFRE